MGGEGPTLGAGPSDIGEACKSPPTLSFASSRTDVRSFAFWNAAQNRLFRKQHVSKASINNQSMATIFL